MSTNVPQDTSKKKHSVKVFCSVLCLLMLSLMAGVWREWMPPTILPFNSISYLDAHENIFQGETNFFRTPTYPQFIQLIRFFIHQEHERLAIVVGQIVLFELSIVFFYLATRMLIRNGILAFLCAAVYGCRYETVIWCFYIMSEGVSIAFVAIFYYLMVVYIKRPTSCKAVSVGMMSLLMIMLKPSFVYVVALLMAFWICRFFFCVQSRRSAGWGMAATLLCVVLTLGYCQLNYRNHGVFTVSYVDGMNNIELVVMTELYDRGPDERMNRFIADFVNNPPKPTHPGLYYDLVDEFSYAEVNDYARQTLRENRSVFLANFFHRLKEPMMEDWHFKGLYALFFIELVVIMTLWVGFRHIPWLHWGVWGMIYGMVFTAFWGSFGEYARLVTPVYSLALVVVFRYFDAIWQFCTLSREKFVEYLKEGL